jgi:Cu(I)/Ag(I) efflux system membrane fusion protein
MMPQEEIDFTEEAIAQLLPLYRPIWKALYSDDLPQAKTAFQTMKEKANEVGAEELSQYLAHAGHAKKLSALRILFRTLSNEMIEAIDNYGPPGERLYVTFCPMAFDDEGAPWIQWENEEILNPYFGSQMLNCGWVERPLEGSEEPEAKQQ